MEPVHPDFVPDPSLSRDEMVALQRDIASTATFADRLDCEHQCCRASDEPPLVAGVDQAFDGDLAVSAVVVTAGDDVVERASAAVETEISYIPGLLAFREGASVLAAFRELEQTPDVALFDGSGRIHYRQAGLATHVGVILDLPTIGVIKTLLCGEPREPLDEPLAAGTRVPIDPDDAVDTPVDGPIGCALQTRQFEGADRYVNPVYVSPGHRVGLETAVDVVEQCCAGYKLPEPIRLADQHAAALTE